MILTISAQQSQLNSPIDARFGRANWLIIFDTETNHWEAFPNPGTTQSGGAGVAAAQAVIDHGSQVVISGAFGPNASDAFKAAQIEMRLFNNEISTVQQAVDYFKQGKLQVFE
jgi:predicted Fe-Mo cluster-binding NifX family protein